MIKRSLFFLLELWIPFCIRSITAGHWGRHTHVLWVAGMGQCFQIFRPSQEKNEWPDRIQPDWHMRQLTLCLHVCQLLKHVYTMLTSSLFPSIYQIFSQFPSLIQTSRGALCMVVGLGRDISQPRGQKRVAMDKTSCIYKVQWQPSEKNPATPSITHVLTHSTPATLNSSHF